MRILHEIVCKLKLYISNFFVFLIIILFTGCSREDKADLVIANSVEPESLDPAIITGQADARIVNSLFEGLVRLDPESATPIPGLAERWEISEDEKKYTFFLRKGLRWSDSKRIQASDVERSWLRALDPSTGARYATLMFTIKGAENYHLDVNKSEGVRPAFKALDEERFEVQLSRPSSYFLHLLTMPIFAVVPTHAIENDPVRWILSDDVPVNGAYKLVWWRLNDSIRLQKNPMYWDAGNTHLGLVDFLPISNPSTALNLYLTDQVDVIWDKDLIPSQVVDLLKTREDFHQFDYLGTYFLRFNTTHPPLDNPLVRKALSLAIDRKRITDRITRAGEIPTLGIVPPYTLGFNSFPINSDQLETPSRLLAQAGYPEGKDFPTLEYYFNGASSGPASNHEKIAVELQAMWKEVLNINVRLKKNEWKVFLDDQQKLNYQISRSSWIGDYNDPNTFLELFTSYDNNNRTGWNHKPYDSVLFKAHNTLDIQTRKNLYQEADKILKEEWPIAPIYFYKGTHLFNSSKVSGIHFNVLDRHPLRAIKKQD